MRKLLCFLCLFSTKEGAGGTAAAAGQYCKILVSTFYLLFAAHANMRARPASCFTFLLLHLLHCLDFSHWCCMFIHSFISDWPGHVPWWWCRCLQGKYPLGWRCFEVQSGNRVLKRAGEMRTCESHRKTQATKLISMHVMQWPGLKKMLSFGCTVNMIWHLFFLSSCSLWFLFSWPHFTSQLASDLTSPKHHFCFCSCTKRRSCAEGFRLRDPLTTESNCGFLGQESYMTDSCIKIPSEWDAWRSTSPDHRRRRSLFKTKMSENCSCFFLSSSLVILCHSQQNKGASSKWRGVPHFAANHLLLLRGIFQRLENPENFDAGTIWENCVILFLKRKVKGKG